MASSESATRRLARLLTMVPWLVNRQGIDIDEAARELGVDRAQIEADLSLLFVCGTPGHMPDDLIEAEWEHGRVFLRNADTIARPLRLGRDEAMALTVGLRALAAVPGIEERDAIDRALAKLTQAAGLAQEDAARVQVALSDDDHAQTLATLRSAVSRNRRVHLRYLVPARDESTERDVDPMRLVALSGHWYFEGWCHRAEDVRLFRLDRVEEVTVLDEDGTPPQVAVPRDVETSLFTHGPDDVTATVRLEPEAAWVVDYYPVEQVDRDEDSGRLTVQLRTADMRWLERLVRRLGGAARVVEPESLRRRVAHGAAQALAQYGAGDPSGG